MTVKYSSALRQIESFRTVVSQSQSHLSLASLIMPKFELFEIGDFLIGQNSSGFRHLYDLHVAYLMYLKLIFMF